MSEANPFSCAKLPFWDSVLKNYPHTEIFAHGKYIGLPSDQAGNSESGHMNIGSGRVVEQDVVRINKSIENKTFFKNSAFQGAIRHIKKMNSKIHLIGMLSDGQSPHCDPKHFFALLELFKKEKIEDKNICIHIFTDGRDSPKYSSLKLLNELEKKHLKNLKINTIMGRFYAMDRRKKWDRTEIAYDALVSGIARKADSVNSAIAESYNKENSDEFIEPYVIGDFSNSRVNDGDSILFFNLRSDRSRQLTKAFVQNDFYKMNPDSFERKKKLSHLYFVTMTDFGPDLDDVLTAYPSVDLENTLPMCLSSFKQLYLAETEKYAHVTYFFNGGYSGIVAGEDQLMVESPNVRSYDLKPEMSSQKLTKIVIDNLSKKGAVAGVGKYDLTVLNFAAPDMIGHTGNFKAAIECLEKVDKYLKLIVEEYLKVNGTVLITADHGNIEEMINLKTGEIFTEHTTNKVPFVLINKDLVKVKLKSKGSLRDIAPTVLDLFGIKKNEKMTGESLINFKLKIKN